ncbi:MAG: thioredoxin fold domain-containing protein [Gammaproteobacteria bacterium]|nr:thioredoxin fold domain-containing protein [Gammaproteobacteria bacterium]
MRDSIAVATRFLRLGIDSRAVSAIAITCFLVPLPVTDALADPVPDAGRAGQFAAAGDAALLEHTAQERHDPTGESPLMLAVRERRVGSVEVLLDAGADPDRRNRSGETSLHLAVRGDPDIIKLLLEAGANPNAQDTGGVTPLMLAAAAGREDSTKMLRGAGARLDMKDYQGASVRDWALRGGHRALAARLEAQLDNARTVPASGKSGADFAEDVFVDVTFPEWFKTSFLDLREDLADAIDAGKQGIALFISASRCSYCKAFMDRSLEDPEIRSRLTAGFDVIGLDIFDDSELTTVEGEQVRMKEFVTLNRASFTPTLIFLGEEGRVLLRIVGYYPPERFRRVLDYLETRAYLNQHFRDYLAASSSRIDRGNRPIIADELFTRPPYMLDRSIMPAQRPLLVVFEHPGCDACERFHRRVMQDRSVRRLIGEFEAVQLDAGDEDGRVVTPGGEKETPRGWYRRLDLSYLPAVLFFDERGREVMRLDSETQRFRMEGTLQLVLERAYTKDAQLQRWRRDKAIESVRRQSGG